MNVVAEETKSKAEANVVSHCWQHVRLLKTKPNSERARKARKREEIAHYKVFELSSVVRVIDN